jgi:transmembrane sensor
MSINKELIHHLALEELAGVISDEDRAYLHRVIEEYPEAFEVWQETRQVLDTRDVREFLARPRPVENIFRVPPPRQTNIWRLLSLSAAALVVVGLGAVYFFTPKSPAIDYKHINLQLTDGQRIDLSVKPNEVTKAFSSPQEAILTVPAGKDYKIKLPDGTTVWLNAATTLLFPTAFTGNRREITINGEAYLEVAKDVKPFLVHLPEVTLQVLGTAFNVNTYDVTKVKVSLVSGAVRMVRGKDSLLLKPGNEITCTPDSGIQVSDFDATALLNWREGLYVFNDAPLSEIIQIFPRWFGQEVVIDDPSKKDLRFTGAINRSGSPLTPLDALKAVSNSIDYYKEGDVIHIK